MVNTFLFICLTMWCDTPFLYCVTSFLLHTLCRVHYYLHTKRLSPFFQLNQLGNIFQIALYEFIPIQNILFGDERELLLLWIFAVWNSASKYILKHHSMSPLRTGYTNESAENVCQWISFYILHCRISNKKEGEKWFFCSNPDIFILDLDELLKLSQWWPWSSNG